MGTIGATLAIAAFIATFAGGIGLGNQGGGKDDVSGFNGHSFDADGFPTGRRLADDVTDIELRVIAG